MAASTAAWRFPVRWRPHPPARATLEWRQRHSRAVVPSCRETYPAQAGVHHFLPVLGKVARRAADDYGGTLFTSHSVSTQSRRIILLLVCDGPVLRKPCSTEFRVSPPPLLLGVPSFDFAQKAEQSRIVNQVEGENSAVLDSIRAGYLFSSKCPLTHFKPASPTFLPESPSDLGVSNSSTSRYTIAAN